MGTGKNDQLFGDYVDLETVPAGNDWLNGGGGNDQLAGGYGSDVFTCGPGDKDTMLDYRLADRDHIVDPDECEDITTVRLQ